MTKHRHSPVDPGDLEHVNVCRTCHQSIIWVEPTGYVAGYWRALPRARR
jgi:hypothetical protein